MKRYWFLLVLTAIAIAGFIILFNTPAVAGVG